jgi:hypothetical protein
MAKELCSFKVQLECTLQVYHIVDSGYFTDSPVMILVVLLALIVVVTSACPPGSQGPQGPSGASVRVGNRLWVDAQHGSDANSGGISAPLASFQKALSLLPVLVAPTSGWEINLAAGNYAAGSHVLPANVVVQGMGAWQTQVTNMTVLVTSNSSHTANAVEFKALTLQSPNINTVAAAKTTFVIFAECGVLFGSVIAPPVIHSTPTEFLVRFLDSFVNGTTLTSYAIFRGCEVANLNVLATSTVDFQGNNMYGALTATSAQLTLTDCTSAPLGGSQFAWNVQSSVGVTIDTGCASLIGVPHGIGISTTYLDDAFYVNYEPGVPSAWVSNPFKVSDALDQLGSRTFITDASISITGPVHTPIMHATGVFPASGLTVNGASSFDGFASGTDGQGQFIAQGYMNIVGGFLQVTNVLHVVEILQGFVYGNFTSPAVITVDAAAVVCNRISGNSYARMLLVNLGTSTGTFTGDSGTKFYTNGAIAAHSQRYFVFYCNSGTSLSVFG